jgi:hypothetical protein
MGDTHVPVQPGSLSSCSHPPDKHNTSAASCNKDGVIFLDVDEDKNSTSTLFSESVENLSNDGMVPFTMIVVADLTKLCNKILSHNENGSLERSFAI